MDEYMRMTQYKFNMSVINLTKNLESIIKNLQNENERLTNRVYELEIKMEKMEMNEKEEMQKRLSVGGDLYEEAKSYFYSQ